MAKVTDEADPRAERAKGREDAELVVRVEDLRRWDSNVAAPLSMSTAAIEARSDRIGRRVECRAGWTAVQGGMPCRVDCRAGWNAVQGGLPCRLECRGHAPRPSWRARRGDWTRRRGVGRRCPPRRGRRKRRGASRSAARAAGGATRAPRASCRRRRRPTSRLQPRGLERWSFSRAAPKEQGSGRHGDTEDALRVEEGILDVQVGEPRGLVGHCEKIGFERGRRLSSSSRV